MKKQFLVMCLLGVNINYYVQNKRHKGRHELPLVGATTVQTGLGPEVWKQNPCRSHCPLIFHTLLLGLSPYILPPLFRNNSIQNPSSVSLGICRLWILDQHTNYAGVTLLLILKSHGKYLQSGKLDSVLLVFVIIKLAQDHSQRRVEESLEQLQKQASQHHMILWF